MFKPTKTVRLCFNGQHFMQTGDESPKLTVAFRTELTKNWFNEEFGPEPLALRDSGGPQRTLPGKPQELARCKVDSSQPHLM
jgi:hypothetical protein